MRSGFTILLMAAILFGGGYWYLAAMAICPVPMAYRIGTVDSRFDLSTEEVRNAVSVAESLWEDATGRNLFTYDEGGVLSINFVFDERQQTANDEEHLRETLDEKEEMSDTVRAQYEKLLAEYESLSKKYDGQTSAYETKLAAYNKEVNEWNVKGGAPEDVFNRLADTKETLAREQSRLNGVGDSLNTLVRKMNALSEKGNSLITDYNETVEVYNDQFSEGHEFTQGDYENKVINIYQYDSEEELELVLAHEFGHALSLEHVEGTDSIMYRLMEGQSKETGIQSADLTEFERVCGTERSTARLLMEIVGGYF
jgi:vacuolar-type H+-ATPase subunit D/Vma8